MILSLFCRAAQSLIDRCCEALVATGSSTPIASARSSASVSDRTVPSVEGCSPPAPSASFFHRARRDPVRKGVGVKVYQHLFLCNKPPFVLL
jgi:hypothetical protein